MLTGTRREQLQALSTMVSTGSGGRETIERAIRHLINTARLDPQVEKLEEAQHWLEIMWSPRRWRRWGLEKVKIFALAALYNAGNYEPD